MNPMCGLKWLYITHRCTGLISARTAARGTPSTSSRRRIISVAPYRPTSIAAKKPATTKKAFIRNSPDAYETPLNTASSLSVAVCTKMPMNIMAARNASSSW